ncbi:MAG TPA: UDP-3-O-(3-hydroxymyristoyl)glucosamine N-acyltransferase [Bacillota bacterium]|nr:UDP-3-O-(3-hydroxymyristoyl)glucosamine N-acyltransferase [Bacillota bacterium]HPT66875.1 UDP-3-O-(3-hydroxymyristoyl)glucosamine N-acyltransferase [Bacillota bacterium]
MTTLAELAKLVGGEVVGDPELKINGVSGIEDAQAGTITLVASAKLLPTARESRASAFILSNAFPDIGRPGIKVNNPRLAFALILDYFAPKKRPGPGVHPSAVVGENVKFGEDVSVGPGVVIGDRVTLGDRVIIKPGVVIEDDVVIGEDSVIHPNVVLADRTIIGSRVIINAGTVIGSDGFGFVTVNGKHTKVPQIGNVVIEDDVEIGANVTIDRATVGTTRIKRGTKMDNLIQIGHNVVIGEDNIIVAMTGIAGSSHTGDRVTLAGQSGVTGHIKIGSDSLVMARGMVIGNLPPNSIVSGSPARPHSEDMRVLAAAGKLPEMLKTVREMQKRLADLEARLQS